LRRAVYVEWADSAVLNDGGWDDLSAFAQKAQDDLTVQTVGFVAHETDEALLIVSTVEERWDRALGALCIPKSAIRTLLELDIPRIKEIPATP
jgi:hypothetical protein